MAKTKTRPKTAATRKTLVRKPLRALTADKYVLYQRAVQEPDADLDFMVEVFEARYGRKPHDLREDFCGTANTACQWVRRHKKNQVWGVDLDPEPLAWGREHNAADLGDEGRARLHLVQGDVRTATVPRVDLVTAQNFSYWIFKTRDALREYFRAAHRGLRDEGLFVVDMFGGPEAQNMGEEETKYRDFTYVWDQAHFDAIQNGILCHIHFKFPDGSQLRQAFSYDWRLWTIPEVREVMLEAGFSATEAYWEGADEEGEGTGEYEKKEHAENEEAWLAYVVGVR